MEAAHETEFQQRRTGDQSMPSGKMLDTIARGDCIEVMGRRAPASVDFILTDPPYVASYRDRTGRTVAGDDNAIWLKPAFAQMYRLLKDNSFCVSFYGWPKAKLFLAAWREAGFRPAGHLVFRKRYSSSAAYLQYRHDQAYLLIKGHPERPAVPLPDVLEWSYTGNRLHPTQKPVSILKPLIGAFSEPGNVVLDPFCGSGSTLAAAQELGWRYNGIELDPRHYRTACDRLLQGLSYRAMNDASAFRKDERYALQDGP
jgi:adenine-specific DNA-methyltransferase